MHRPRFTSLIAGVACALLALSLAAPPAAAQQTDEQRKAKSQMLYREATTQYNLGNFTKAIDLYKKSYAAWPAPVLLFNVAQAYRINGNCKDAIFFYQRYLALEKKVPSRAQIERLVDRLKVDCKREEETRAKPPVQTLPPPDDNGHGTVKPPDTHHATTGDTDKPPATDPDATAPKTTPDDPDKVAANSMTNPENGANMTIETGTGPIIDDGMGTSGTPKLGLMAQFGPAFASFGELDVGGALFSGRLGAAYLMPAGPVGLELGATLTFTPVPFTTRDGTAKTGMFMGALANAGATYPLWNKLSLRGEVGFGLLVLSGITEPGSVFVKDQYGAAGASSVVHVRAAAGVDWALSDNILLNATPLAIAYSPALDGMDEQVSSLSRFEMMVGVAYRL
ncbi:MAG TPA: tetratricopeptide repeat protein [Kofleriaceae bacterium]|nr:tetratricopeptide repeat protein [Kofleriaceae bacterium]